MAGVSSPLKVSTANRGQGSRRRDDLGSVVRRSLTAQTFLLLTSYVQLEGRALSALPRLERACLVTTHDGEVSPLHSVSHNRCTCIPSGRLMYSKGIGRPNRLAVAAT